MKFVLLVEGKTERRVLGPFLKRWLDPKLKSPVGIQIVSFNGYANLDRKMVCKAQMHLDGPDDDDIVAVIGLMDLYGPTFYPDDITQPDKRYEWAVNHFQKRVDRGRFRMFFAVHELEAWLLSQPDIFPREVRSAVRSISSQPERVNFDSPPAKRLRQIYSEKLHKDYKKIINGKQLFLELDPNIAVEKCPHLHQMLTEMLSLAKNADL